MQWTLESSAVSSLKSAEAIDISNKYLGCESGVFYRISVTRKKAMTLLNQAEFLQIILEEKGEEKNTTFTLKLQKEREKYTLNIQEQYKNHLSSSTQTLTRNQNQWNERAREIISTIQSALKIKSDETLATLLPLLKQIENALSEAA